MFDQRGLTAVTRPWRVLPHRPRRFLRPYTTTRKSRKLLLPEQLSHSSPLKFCAPARDASDTTTETASVASCFQAPESARLGRSSGKVKKTALPSQPRGSTLQPFGLSWNAPMDLRRDGRAHQYRGMMSAGQVNLEWDGGL